MDQHTHSTDEMLEFKKVKINPESECLLTDPLSLSVEVSSKVNKDNVEVELQFTADCVHKKIPTKLASFSQNITAGTNTISFAEVPFNVTEIDKSALPNIGLTSIILRTGETELGRITVVTSIKPNGGNLYRIVYNPLE